MFSCYLIADGTTLVEISFIVIWGDLPKHTFSVPRWCMKVSWNFPPLGCFIHKEQRLLVNRSSDGNIWFVTIGKGPTKRPFGRGRTVSRKGLPLCIIKTLALGVPFCELLHTQRGPIQWALPPLQMGITETCERNLHFSVIPVKLVRERTGERASSLFTLRNGLAAWHYTPGDSPSQV